MVTWGGHCLKSKKVRERLRHKSEQSSTARLQNDLKSLEEILFYC